MMKTRRYMAHLGLRSRLARKRWTRHLLFVAGGVCVGLAAISMAFLADQAQTAFGQVLTHSRYWAVLITPLGFAVCMWLAIVVFPNSQGSGVPQVIAALRLPHGDRGPLVSLRVGFGKVVVMTLGLLFGASTGREGPTIQVGGAIMAALGRFAPYRQPGFLLAGSAAGVAAAFNTPLAGIVFAIEELSRSFEMRKSGLIIGAIIAAGLTSLAIVGDYNYFGTTSATLPLGAAWFVVPVCAVLCGILGGLFSRILIRFALGIPGRAGASIRRHPVAFAAACGLGVALCGVMSHEHIFGTGYEQARAILHDGSGAVDYGFGGWKFVATLLSAISGIPGGIFAPSLAIGAGIASDLSLLFPQAPLGALVLIGMVSYLTGVVRAPITSFVITSEMTNDHSMVIPLMAAALIANAASQLVVSEGLYHALAKITLARFPTIAAADAPHPEAPSRSS
jgi:H+/Cl- antiporter ClcA